MSAADLAGRRLGRPGGLAFAAAGLVLLALWAGPLPGLARVSFTSHMILHIALLGLAAPLLGFALIRAGLAGPLRAPWVALAASVADLAVVWSWHLRALHAAAATVPALFVLQQGMFLGVATVLWTASFASPARLSAGAGAAAMGMSFMHMSMLGVVLGRGQGALR